MKAANCLCNATYVQQEGNNIPNENNEVVNFKNIKKLFLSNLFSFNFDVLKCYKLVINLKIFFHNIGFYILFLMLILQIIFFSAYLVKKLDKIKRFMIHFNYQKGKIKKRKRHKKTKTIKIISDKKYKNNNENKNIENKLNLFPPKKSNKIINGPKNTNKKNKKINLIVSNSNIIISKNSFVSQNNLNIYNQKNIKEINNDLKDSKTKDFNRDKDKSKKK